jgi:hypothetical protein
MGVIIALSFLKQDYREEVFICGRLIEISTSIVKDNYAVIVYILIWWLLQIGLIAVTVFELLSAWSIGPLTYRADYPFY